MVDLSAAQDVEAGDGTTTVVVIAGSLLSAAERLLEKGTFFLILFLSLGIHPTIIAEAFQRAAAKGVEHLTEIATKIALTDRASLLLAASTSLNSKIVSQYSALLAPIAVDAVMRVNNPATAENVDLNDIRIVKKVGGTIDDTELVEGLVLNQGVIKNAGGPTRMEKTKIGLIQFQLSPPKPDVHSFPVPRLPRLSSLSPVLPPFKDTPDFRWKIKLSSTIIDKWTKFSKKREPIS